jgi:class 3 adenylate cyclase
MKRKIAAILAADVADYAQLVGRDEAGTLAQLAAGKAVFTTLIGQHEGRVFNAAGDALLAEFSSAVEALRCGVAVQKAVEARELGLSDRTLRFRIGITIGDVIERNGDLFGDGVNIAARLQGLAPGGGICVSRGVYEQVGNRVLVAFTDLGLQKLKNMPDPVQAYLVAGQRKVGDELRGAAGSYGAGTQVAPRASGGAKSAVTWIVGLVLLAIGAAVIWRVQPGRDPGPPSRVPTSTVAPPVPNSTAGAKPDVALPGPGRSSAECRDILERAQLGQLSADDRVVLEQSCK